MGVEFLPMHRSTLLAFLRYALSHEICDLPSVEVEPDLIVTAAGCKDLKLEGVGEKIM